MATAQPPAAAAVCPPGTAPAGSGATANLPDTLEPFSRSWAYSQLRMKAALPAPNALCASSSVNVVTPDGAILPIQLCASLSAAIAFGLSIETELPSMNVPPLYDATHSRALQVRPS